MDKIMPEITGKTALQIACPYAKSLRSAGHEIKIALSSDTDELALTHYATNVVADPEHLPFAQESFDLVVMIHALEFAKDAQALLKEAYRVLAPSGHLIVISLNPWGPWCMKHKHFVGEDCSPMSVNHLKDAMVGDYFFDNGAFGVYCPSLSDNPNRLATWMWIEKAGDRWWPQFSNAYMISGVKRVVTPKPVGSVKELFRVSGKFTPEAAS